MKSRIDYARAYMRTLPLAISGQGGHDTTLYVACELIRRFALNEDGLLLLMREYDGKLAEKWNDKNLRHKVTDALKKTQQAHRSACPTTLRKTWIKPLHTLATSDRVEWEIVPRPVPVHPMQKAENREENQHGRDPAANDSQSNGPQ